MKKRIGILLIIVLVLLLTACGDGSTSDEQSDSPAQEAVNDSSGSASDSGDEISRPTDSPGPAPDIVLHSNEDQFVIRMGKLYTIYSIENGCVTGMTTYCDYETEDLAKRVIEQTKSENDTTIKSYRMVGSTVIISYNEQSFIGLTPEVLESFYASVKVD